MDPLRQISSGRLRIMALNRDIFIKFPRGGGFEIWTFFDKFWTCVAAWLRGPHFSQNIQKGLKYPKIDCRAFAFSRRHYAADNRTARDIPTFWVVKIQGGQCPTSPPAKNIPAKTITCRFSEFLEIIKENIHWGGSTNSSAGGGGGSWQEFFKGGLGSKSVGIFIY